MSAREREQAVTLNVYAQLDLEPVAAEGVYIHTRDGRKILDLYGGHAVAALGYGNPGLTKALADQSSAMIFQSNAVALKSRAQAAEALLEFGPTHLSHVFFANSGGEANENALRLACMITGRREVVALEHGFHGRTAAAAAVTWGSDKRWYGFPQKPFDVQFARRNDIDAIDDVVSQSTAAVIIEPVQGVAGAFDFDGDFLRALRARCDITGTLLIADEVQTGIGRCGAPFAMQRHDVAADIVTSAKSLGGGFPCAALACTPAVASEVRAGDLGSTFGGGPLAVRAIASVLGTITREGLIDNVLAREKELAELAQLPAINRVSGLGFLCGLHVTSSAGEVRDALLEQNILTGTSADPKVVRLLPPLTLSSEHVAMLATAIERIS